MCLTRLLSGCSVYCLWRARALAPPQPNTPQPYCTSCGSFSQLQSLPASRHTLRPPSLQGIRQKCHPLRLRLHFCHLIPHLCLRRAIPLHCITWHSTPAARLKIGGIGIAQPSAVQLRRATHEVQWKGNPPAYRLRLTPE